MLVIALIITLIISCFSFHNIILSRALFASKLKALNSFIKIERKKKKSKKLLSRHNHSGATQSPNILVSAEHPATGEQTECPTERRTATIL